MARPSPAAASVFSACRRGNAVGLTSILNQGQFFVVALYGRNDKG